MSDQAVQNIVNSVKMVLEIFKSCLNQVLSDKAKEANGLKAKLDKMEKEGKDKEKEYEDAKKKLASYDKANIDVGKISKDVDRFMEDLEKNPALQGELYNKYKSALVDELKNNGIKQNDIDEYGKLPEDKKATIEGCRQKALLNATEKLAGKKGLNIPIATFAKDKSLLQQAIERAISRSDKFNMGNAEEDLNKIKNSRDH